MPIPDPDYRPNVERSIKLFGEVNEDLVSRLAPEILRLRSDGSNAPITVLINSRGGTAHIIDYVYGLLTATGAFDRSPRIITVAIGDAKSAAATMLALGSYAIAYPKASIHFHGLRYGKVEDVTMETAEWMATELQLRNRATAATLARVGTERLTLHYARMKERCAEIYKSDPRLSEVDCFAECLKEELSNNGERIIDKAIERWRILRQLSDKVVQKVRASGKKGIDFESTLLRGVIDFEVRRNKSNPDWALNAQGVSQVMSDFLLLRDYDLGRHRQLMKTLIQRFSNTFFEPEHVTKIEESIEKGVEPDEETKKLVWKRMDEVIKPFCYFTASIWQHMQEEENPLTPRDAYWLGAVDEVFDSNLPCLRAIAEADKPDQTNLDLPPNTSQTS